MRMRHRPQLALPTQAVSMAIPLRRPTSKTVSPSEQSAVRPAGRKVMRGMIGLAAARDGRVAVDPEAERGARPFARVVDADAGTAGDSLAGDPRPAGRHVEVARADQVGSVVLPR